MSFLPTLTTKQKHKRLQVKPIDPQLPTSDQALSNFSAMRLARARRLSFTAWVIATILCSTIVMLALTPLWSAFNTSGTIIFSQETVNWLIVAAASVSLTVFATRLYTQQLLRLSLQTAVIERQNAHLRITDSQLRQQFYEREEAENQRDSFFNLSTDILIILDMEGRINRVNPAFCSLIRENEQKLRGTELFSFLPSSDVAALQYTLETIQTDANIRSLETRLVTNDKELWILWTFVARQNWVYAVGHDVTTHRAAADSLRHSKEVAEKANETKTRFLANMSHELRTPLNAIIGFSESLEMGFLGSLNPKQQEYIHDIHTAGHHLLAIVTDLLNLSVIDSGFMPLHESIISPLAAAEETVSFFRQKAEESHITLNIQAPKTIPSIRVDAGKLRQILINLVGNALKFTPRDGLITIILKVEDDGVHFTVKDTGVGINPADIPTVLAPFGRLNATDSGAEGGVGLGLPLACRLAELHKGHISLSSEPGKGTSVSLRLPSERTVYEEKSERRIKAPLSLPDENTATS